MIEPHEEAEQARICEWCDGSFLPDDMDGEHCGGCAADLFEGEIL